MQRTQRLLVGTALLTAAGLISRFIGFFYRIFLSHAIGAGGMGVYQLIFPLFNLAYAFTVMGIQTALSKIVAAKLAVNDKAGAWSVFFTGTLLSFLLSVITGIAVWFSCDWICLSLLEESQCIPLVRLMAFTIPLGSLHICIVSWYFACRNTWIPSIAQLIEQLIRVGASWMMYLVMLHHNLEITPVLAVAGMAAGEIVSLLFIFFFLRKDFQNEIGQIGRLSFSPDQFKELVRLSTPLTANRIILNLMRSIETALIPICLRKYGMTSQDALSVYGVLTGMSLPLILFPSTITHSVAVMLLPKVAESKAQGDNRSIAFTVEKTIRYGLFLGILMFGIFYHCGESIGTLFYHNQQAGQFISILSYICPFLYLSSTLSSIINGLGKTGFYFFHSLTGLLLRILFVVFLVPKIGIVGYLWGTLANEIVLVLLSMFALYRENLLIFSAVDTILKPFCFLLVSSGCALFGQQLLTPLALSSFITLILYCVITCCIYFELLLTFDLIHLPKMPRQFHFLVDKK